MTPPVNFGICQTCSRRVPATHVVRDGKVFLAKDCPDCGRTEGLVSSDAAAWQCKRDLYGYRPGEGKASCTLNCEACGHTHPHRMVFAYVTNRCNMNCPICVENVSSMGFRFDPPLDYFRKLFDGIGRMKPTPVLHLFGGEPTVREDLFDIIGVAHENGLRVHLNTNGLRLADEDYCRRVCESDVAVLYSLDGLDPAIDGKMRKNPAVNARKRKGLENLRRFSKRRWNIIMCVVARGINDHHIAEMFRLCHEHRNHIKGLYFLPLTAKWDEGRFEGEFATTIEDTERIVNEAFEDAEVTYLPLGLQHHLNRALEFLGVGDAQTFPDIHPNCEAGANFFSDGDRYLPLGYYLRRPLREVAEEAIRRAKRIDSRLARLDAGRRFQRLRGRLLVLRTFGGLIASTLDFRRAMRGNRWVSVPRLALGLMAGNAREQFSKHTRLGQALDSIILPFEEKHSLESERLAKCSAGYAYLDPLTERVKTLPVCVWEIYRTGILKAISERYGCAGAGGGQEAASGHAATARQTGMSAPPADC